MRAITMDFNTKIVMIVLSACQVLWLIFMLTAGGAAYDHSRRRWFVEFAMGPAFLLAQQFKPYSGLINSITLFALQTLTIFSNGGYSQASKSAPTAITVMVIVLNSKRLNMWRWLLVPTAETLLIVSFFACGTSTGDADHYWELGTRCLEFYAAAALVHFIIYQRSIAEAKFEHSIKMREQILERTSHELATPLAGIIGNVELMAPSEVTNATLLCAKSARSLIDQILSWSKINSGATTKPSHFHLHTLFENVCEMMKRNKRPHCRIEYACHVDSLVYQDSAKLQQVLVGLVSNADKYSPDGGLIKMTGHVERQELILTISDQGVGFSPKDSKSIFKPFVQKGTRQGGVGLGLAIASKLCQSMGGAIGGHSDGEGKGATFTVRLPAGCVDKDGNGDSGVDPVLKSPLCTPRDEEEDLTQKGSVLIVEDSPLLQVLLRKQLEKLGYTEISSVENGLDALAYCDGCSKPPRLIFSDILMPGGLDGFQLCRILRENGFKGRLFGVSALQDAKHVQRSVEVGMDGYISKPITLRSLQQAMMHDDRSMPHAAFTTGSL